MKSPAFQFYPGDWLGSTKISLMTPEQEGAYIRLLCHMWGQDDCSLPKDDTMLSKLSRLEEKWNENKEIILKCFSEKNGKIFNKRLSDEKKKQNKFRQKQASNGSKGGRPKKGLGFSGLSQTKAKKSSSSPSSSSSSSSDSLLSSKLQIFEYLRRAADNRIPDSTIEYQADELVKKYTGKPVRNLQALCSEWASNIEIPVKKLYL
ncbi:MAG: DUF1376 domain-containing protein [Chitinophagaceae bacterium]